jgi:hypothetical protein
VTHRSAAAIASDLAIKFPRIGGKNPSSPCFWRVSLLHTMIVRRLLNGLEEELVFCCGRKAAPSKIMAKLSRLR